MKELQYLWKEYKTDKATLNILIAKNDECLVFEQEYEDAEIALFAENLILFVQEQGNVQLVEPILTANGWHKVDEKVYIHYQSYGDMRHSFIKHIYMLPISADNALQA